MPISIRVVSTGHAGKYNYFELLREIKSVSFATVDENGHPQVRIIDVMIVEDEKLYFVTARGKDFYKQLTHKKEVAIIGINKEYQTVRMFGKVKKIDKKWVDRVFEENPVMNNIYPGDSRHILGLLDATEGNVFIQGEDIATLNQIKLRRNIGYVIQGV